MSVLKLVQSCFSFWSFCTNANRGCPDVINWSISANNTAAQTHHYRKALLSHSISLSQISQEDKPKSNFIARSGLWEWEWNLSSVERGQVWVKTAGGRLSEISCLVMDRGKTLIYCPTLRLRWTKICETKSSPNRTSKFQSPNVQPIFTNSLSLYPYVTSIARKWCTFVRI